MVQKQKNTQMKTIKITALDLEGNIVSSRELQGTMMVADRVRHMILGAMVLGWDVYKIEIS